MKVSSEAKTAPGAGADLLIVPIPSSELKAGDSKKAAGGATLKRLEAEYGAPLAARLAREEFSGKMLETILFRNPGHRTIPSLLIVAWNRDEVKNPAERLERLRDLGHIVAKHAALVRAETVRLDASAAALEQPGSVRALIEGLRLSRYEYRAFKSEEKKKSKKQHKIETLIIRGAVKRLEREVELAKVICAAVDRARDMVNTPPNRLRPSDMIELCRAASRRAGLEMRVIDNEKLKRMGTGGITGVGQGSDNAPALIELTYTPGGKKKKKKGGFTTLVGKGITFDTGGLSIKPSSNMETMKCDMSGGAAVIAVMEALSELKSSRAVRGFIPTAENMIDGEAMRPSDVIKIVNGKTVEVLNTDAEGRLILADALSIAASEKPREIIDLATLTGACVVALGPEYAGLFSNDDRLAEKLKAAGDRAGERLWRLPLAPEYRPMLKSSVADFKNSFGREGGAITAALFLEEFVDKVPWAHLDIAAPAFIGGDDGYLARGGVGFGVRTLLEYLIS